MSGNAPASFHEQFHPSRLVGVSQAHPNAGQPEDRFLVWANRIRTSESMRTLANHCFLMWFMVPKSATERARSIADFGTTTLGSFRPWRSGCDMTMFRT